VEKFRFIGDDLSKTGGGGGGVILLYVGIIFSWVASLFEKNAFILSVFFISSIIVCGYVYAILNE
jgi:hypothetical protein